MSNKERACLSRGLANHLKYVQHLAFLEGQVLGQISMSSQTESRCWVVCCFKAAISMTSMSSTRMLNSYPVARIALNIDHAQLWREDTTAAVQQSSAMSLYIVPAGLPAKLFQNLAARKSQTCCRDFKPSSAKRMSVDHSMSSGNVLQAGPSLEAEGPLGEASVPRVGRCFF